MGWYEFLPGLLNMSVTGSIIILAVLAVRLCLKKAPKVFSYALWAVVLFRLLCPVSFSSEWSLLQWLDVPVAENGAMEYIPVDIVHTEYPEVSLPEPDFSNGAEIIGESVIANSNEKDALADGTEIKTQAGAETPKPESILNENLPQGREQPGADPLELPVMLGTYIWGLGALALLIYNMVQLGRLRRRLRVAEPLQGNIYLADYIEGPFVLGLVRPRIYLPSSLTERERSYIILHEQYHIRRGDHVVKVLAFAALCIHWFNPLVWLAFLLASKDMEMSCDEAVMKQMEEDIRAEYAGSLLQLAIGRRWLSGVTLAFGEGDTKARVKNVMSYKKPGFWVLLVAMVVCVVAVICLIANPKQELPTPFGKVYEGMKVSYDASGIANYRKEVEKDAIYYYLTEDMHLMAKGRVQIQKKFFYWMDLGQMEEVRLTQSNYDRLFYADNSGYKVQYVDTLLSRREERQTFHKAWQLISGDEEYPYNYYLIQKEDGELQLACWQMDASDEEYSVMKWITDLGENTEIELTEWGMPEETIYQSTKCLYMNPASSYMSLNGDSGYYYRFTKESFDEIVKQPGEMEGTVAATYSPIKGLIWQEFPYTEEEWKEMFIGGGELGGVPIPYEEKRYMYLSSREFLLQMDGELWLVHMSIGDKGDYVWSIYVLAPVDSAVVAESTPILALENAGPVIGATYRSSERLATSYDTDVWLLDGDSGCLYKIEEDAMVIINEADGVETRIPVEKWEWQEFPYTEEEWNSIAERSSYLQDMHSKFGEVKYQPIGEDYFLLLLNYMMVFGEYVDFRPQEHETYLGDAFTLVPEGTGIETAVIERIYESDYKDSPDAAYPAEAWLTEDGRVEYPSDALILKEDSTLTERFTRFYIPQEVLINAETEDLLRLSAEWPMSSYGLYNYLCYYLDFLTLKFNGADELIHRPDMAEAVLAEYRADSFLPLTSLGDAKEQKAYDEKCYARVEKIVLEEILLASNRAFDQMDEEMKQATLKEALQKVEQRQSGKFKCSMAETNSVSQFSSGFFSYILEQKEAGSSKWYQYLVETGETQLVEKLKNLSPYACRP